MSSSPSFTPFADLAASSVPHLGYADLPRVRAILAAEGIPAPRLEHLAMVFTNASTDDAQVRALVARARTAVPELFASPEPLPSSDAAHALAEAHGLSSSSPERQAALARKCARDDAENAALARLGALLAYDRAEASDHDTPPDSPPISETVRRIAEARGWVTERPEDQDAPADDAGDASMASLGQRAGA